MTEIEKKNILSHVSLGSIAPDAIITNGVLFHFFTREFSKKRPLWTKDGRIAYVGPDHEPAHAMSMQKTEKSFPLKSWQK